MTTYDNTNKGTLSKNTRKEKDSHPDVNGTINVEGAEYWLSGWKKERKDGTGTFYSLALKKKEAKPGQAEQAETSGSTEDVPF